MLGLFRTEGGSRLNSPRSPTFLHPRRASTAMLSPSPTGDRDYYSDYEYDSDRSTSPMSNRGGFIALVVSGPNAVAQFEASFPTQFKRCHLARLVSLGRSSGTPYSVTLEEHYDWRVGSEFDSFVQRIIPESMRAHLAVYDVSDWDQYSYWNVTTSSTTGADIAVTPPTTDSEFDTNEHDQPLPKRSRALDSLTPRAFGDFGQSQSAHASPIKPKKMPVKRPWPRLSSQQTSPMLQAMQPSNENKIPRDLTLLATDAPTSNSA